MRFPVESLRPTCGTISAALFENDFVGLDESLFWSISIDFAPVDFIYGAMESSLTVDYIRLPVRDWRALSGLTLGDPATSGVPVAARRLDQVLTPELFEASFYILGHDMANRCLITFGERTGTSFVVDVEMDVELIGYGDNEGGGGNTQRVRITTSTVLPFTGVTVEEPVVPAGAEHTHDAVITLGRHMDVRTFASPTARTHSFHFAPLLDGTPEEQRT
jgi:hypothetical protein